MNQVRVISGRRGKSFSSMREAFDFVKHQAKLNDGWFAEGVIEALRILFCL
jgi:hypothetical protein